MTLGVHIYSLLLSRSHIRAFIYISKNTFCSAACVGGDIEKAKCLMNFRLMEFPEGSLFFISPLRARIYYMRRACRRNGIAVAVKAKRTSLSSLAPKMTPPISPELPVYARVSAVPPSVVFGAGSSFIAHLCHFARSPFAATPKL